MSTIQELACAFGFGLLLGVLTGTAVVLSVIGGVLSKFSPKG